MNNPENHLLSDDHAERRLYLLDGFYKDVLSRSVSDDGLRTARAAKIGKLIVFRGHIAAYKLISPAGHPYILVLYIRSGLGELKHFLLGHGLPFAISMSLLVTIFCFLLAYHIVSPINSIQTTARKVAQGDLKARVPASVSKRYDELAALAKDFDSMVGRLDLLIQTQKNLLNSVSHELRSPLTRINLCLALLKKSSSADEEGTFQRLDRDVARIDLLLEQLLTLSRLESGLSSAQRQDVDLVQLVEEVVADGNFEAHMVNKSVSLRAPDPIILRHADPHALRSACENIIRNSIRFTKPGSEVQIVLGLDRDTSGVQALLTVRDHGPGVPEESLQAIFEPFFRIPGDANSIGGNGLGLAIAFEAVRLHGGTLHAVNLHTTGLEVKLQLPIGDGNAE
ncbi:HAMP domain-containing protein [Edaphobacter sp. HDX4]|uniref:sensor histidine kinase n=1 Tax=Edaphobacter sp. HDX4 TaxID=2794064 RepID=UPI002FE59EA7